MILVNNKGILIYKKKQYKCALGINGISKNKVEGDGCTPAGLFSLGKLLIRKDKIKQISTSFNYITIKENMAWSDNPKSTEYNKLIKLKTKSKENLFRRDNVYDLVLVINYNIKPIIPYKGSAIFLHVQKNNYESTRGCVALQKKDFIEILTTLDPKDKIKISSY